MTMIGEGLSIDEGDRVAVVDDVREFAETTAGIAEEAGLIPTIISEDDGHFNKIKQLAARMHAAQCLAVVCDHRLSQRGFANFTGAAFVASQFREGFPGVLHTTFAADEGDTAIRQHMVEIPSLLDKQDLEPNRLLYGLRLSAAELAGHITPERQPRRTLVRIVDIYQESSNWVAEAILHSWDPDCPIRFPIQVVENPTIRSALTQNFHGETRLFAEVNVGCHSAKDLFFKAFEFAPEPDVQGLSA